MRRGKFLLAFEYTRQIDTEAAAFAYRTVHPNVAATLLHGAIDHGEAKACAFAEFFGGEKRFENMRLGFFIHAEASVGNGKHDVTAGDGAEVALRVRIIEFDVRGLERNSAAVGHGIARVDNEIEDDLFDLSGVGF